MKTPRIPKNPNIPELLAVCRQLEREAPAPTRRQLALARIDFAYGNVSLSYPKDHPAQLTIWEWYRTEKVKLDIPCDQHTTCGASCELWQGHGGECEACCGPGCSA